MDLPQPVKNYTQKYRTKWEKEKELKDWLTIAPDGAYCNICNCHLAPKFCDLKSHADTDKHKRKAMSQNKNVKLNFPVAKKAAIKKSLKAEGTIALYIVEHGAVSNVDHLTDAMKKCFDNSTAVIDLKMHRTKCTQVIKNVSAPHFKQMLLDDIGNQKFSFLIDESTDVCSMKYVGIGIRYFSSKLDKIVSSFLSLEPVEVADAPGLAKALVNYINSNGLEIKNMVSIGTDNCNVMTGVNAGLHEILRTKYNLPNLVLIKCVCHSLQLAVSHASEKTLPRNIEFSIRETYNRFSHSPKRQEEYKEVYKSINFGEEPLKILRACNTRWLSIEPAVSRFLLQWTELKFHFETTSDKCYTAQMLANMYNDPANQVYLTFLKSVLNDVQIALKTFEKEDSNPVELLNTLMSLLRALCVRIMMPNAATTDMDFLQLNIDNYLDPTAHLGHLFQRACDKSKLSTADINHIKTRCIDFNKKLIKEIQNRSVAFLGL